MPMNTLIIITILSLIVTPTALVLWSRDDFQKRKAADRFFCTNCGRILGAPAIDLADIKQQELIDRLQHEYPNMKLRLAPRTVAAICTYCGTQFAYLKKTKTFKAEPKTLTD